MCLFKAVEPMVPKELIGPAIVVPAPTDPPALAPLAKDGSQAAANPAVNGWKGPVAHHGNPALMVMSIE